MTKRGSALAAVALLAASAMLGVAPVAPAQQAVPTPALCQETSVRTYWSYHFVDGVKEKWDKWGEQSVGVCVWPEATPPPDGACLFQSDAPLIEADGTGRPLCWFGSRPPMAPAVQPRHCEPTDAAVVLADLREKGVPWVDAAHVASAWGYFCTKDGGAPPRGCGQLLAFVSETGRPLWLCWWPPLTGAPTGVRAVDAATVFDVADAALASGPICGFIGKALVFVRVNVDDRAFRVVVNGCFVDAVQGITPPLECKPIGRAEAAALSPRLQVESQGVCTRVAGPAEGACLLVVPMVDGGGRPRSYLCFYGPPRDQATRFSFSLSADALRAVANARDPTNTAKNLLAGGFVAINAANPVDQAKVKVALSDFLGDQVAGEPFDPSVEFEFDGQNGGALRLPQGWTLISTPEHDLVVNDQGSPIGFFPSSYWRFVSRTQGVGTNGETVQVWRPWSSWNREPAAPRVPGGLLTISVWVDEAVPLRGSLSEPPDRIQALFAPSGLGPDQTFAAAYASLVAGRTALEPPDDPENADPFVAGVFQAIHLADGRIVVVGPDGVVSSEGLADVHVSLSDVKPCNALCRGPVGGNPYGSEQGRAYLGGAIGGALARDALLEQGFIGGGES